MWKRSVSRWFVLSVLWNENVKSESRESAIYGLDDDTQKKYQTDINKKLQKQKHLEYQKENLLKKKNMI